MLLFVAITWEFYFILEYILHQLGHKRIDLPILRNIHEVHIMHHKLYPPNKLLQKQYQTGDAMWVFIPITLSLFGAAYLVLQWKYFLVFSVEIAALLCASDYLHTEFHKEGTWLEKYKVFHKMRKTHFHHHTHAKKNMALGGIDYSWDKILGTYVEC